jgi:large subunit ribosomal protein L3
MIGLIGKKIGMTQVFDDDGVLTPVTVVKIEDNYVVGSRTTEKDGYEACVLGSEELHPNRVTSPYAGQFKNGVKPQRYLVEIRDFSQEVEVGQRLGVNIFEGLTYVDVTGTAKGKGYQGVMRRHGFSGGRKSHGSKFHREAGSTGMAATPSKVQKGSRMPGRMGANRTTAQNRRLVAVDGEHQLLLIRGAIPGRRNGMVVVKQAKKK